VFEVDGLLLRTEYLGGLNTFACNLTIGDTWGVRTLDDLLSELLPKPSFTIFLSRLKVECVNVTNLLEIGFGDEIKNNVA